MDNFYVEIKGQCNVDCNTLTTWTDTANIDWGGYYKYRQPYDQTPINDPFNFEYIHGITKETAD